MPDTTKHQCPHCDYRTSQKSNLSQHLRVHTGEKPFACTHCDYQASRKENLTRHLRIHTGEKPFACEHCNYRASHKSTLTEHQHIHTGEKPFACEHCNSRFNQKSKLTEHLRIHTGEKPFLCEHCGYRAHQLGNLNVHLRIHTGEKPFACEYCDFRTSYSTHLTKHTQLHAQKQQNVGVVAIAQPPTSLDLLLAAAASIAEPVKQEPQPEASYHNRAQFNFSEDIKNKFTLANLAHRTSLPLYFAHEKQKQFTLALQVLLRQWLQPTMDGWHITEKYSNDMDTLLYPFDINAFDPRIALRGQKGIKAKQPLMPFTPIGIYVGNVSLQHEFEQQDALRYSWETLQQYLFDLQGKIQRIPYSMVIDAERCGNWTALINANTTYEPSVPDTTRANCTFVKIHYLGVPMIIVITNEKPITPHTELLVDYGIDYWRNQREKRTAYLRDIGSATDPFTNDDL